MAALIADAACTCRSALSGAASSQGNSLELPVAQLVTVAVAHQTAWPALARIPDFEERRLTLGGESAAQRSAAQRSRRQSGG